MIARNWNINFKTKQTWKLVKCSTGDGWDGREASESNRHLKIAIKTFSSFLRSRYWLMEFYNENWGKKYVIDATGLRRAGRVFQVLNFYIHNFNGQQLWVNGIRDTLNKINWKLHFMAIKCAIIQMLVCVSLLSIFVIVRPAWTARLEESFSCGEPLRYHLSNGFFNLL